MPVVLVCADDVLALAQGLVRDHLDSSSDGPDRAALGTERLADLALFSGPEGLAEHRQELHLVETVVTADEREQDPAVRDHRHRLRSRAGVHFEECGDVLDRALPRRFDLLRLWQLRRKLRRRGHSAGDLEIGRVVAVLAGDERVLAGAGRREEVEGLAAAHHSRLCLHLI